MAKPRSLKGTLIAARKLIENYDNWTQGKLHRPAGSLYPDRYCMLGAINEVDGEYEGKAVNMLADTIQKEYYPQSTATSGMSPTTKGKWSITSFNDALGRRTETQHKAVLKMFDKAIERCK